MDDILYQLVFDLEQAVRMLHTECELCQDDPCEDHTRSAAAVIALREELDNRKSVSVSSFCECEDEYICTFHT